MYGLPIRSLRSLIKTEFLYFTDDEQEAVEMMGTYLAEGEKNVTYGRVKSMLNPPETDKKFVVLKVEGL